MPANKFGLTDRQIEVLQTAVDSPTYQTIADELGIKRNTVKTHLVSIREKMGVLDTTQAVVKAYYYGIVDIHKGNRRKRHKK